MAVRSTFAGLNTMYRGISTNRLSLETVGHNMTNASAPGYSRQRVNQAATSPDEIYTTAGQQYVGSGTDSLSIKRARDIYADKQFWRENSTLNYYEARRKNYQKLEVVFKDNDKTGLQAAMADFYKSWVDMSKEASNTSQRVAILEKAGVLCDRMHSSAKQLQEQIKGEYLDLGLNVTKVNELTSQIVELNRAIMSREAGGGTANDLRDARDNLADELSQYMSVSVNEDKRSGMYTIVSNGVSIVNGITKLNLTLGPKDADGKVVGIPNKDYGITDYNIEIDGTGVVFDPLAGKLKAKQDSIAEDKGYIDNLANMAAFLMTTFNDQHQQGIGMDQSRTSGLNFFGDQNALYEWTDTGTPGRYYVKEKRYAGGLTSTPTVVGGKVKVNVTGTGASVNDELRGYRLIDALRINQKLTATDGERLIASAAWEVQPPATPVKNGTADGEVAVLLSTLLNQGDSTRTVATCATGESSLVNYYNNAMTKLGVDASSCQTLKKQQEDVIEQVSQWRSETAGVNWDEELTNMITFQQGYSACSRCLTTMDEMLDKLINGTGMVGR
ncbi:MAG: flagellar hook-associated protein FlgK [Schwartzia sp. (in: firmicutes)]